MVAHPAASESAPMSTPLPPGEQQAAFLDRISRALGRTGPTVQPPPAPLVDEGVVRLVPRSADLLGVFASTAVAAGMVVHRTVAAHVPRCVSALAVDLKLRKAAAADDPYLQDASIGLTAAGVVLEQWRRCRGLEGLYGVDAGLTAVHAAIAETGSLVCGSMPGRGLSLVPPVHIAVVRRSQILPDLVDYWALYSGESPVHQLPSNLVFITGPSKTADIEGVLITGVHGPREVHIVLVEDA